MLFRTPVTPIVAGLVLDVAGGTFAEPFMAVLFAASVVAWTAAARAFGARVALLVAAALLVYPAYGLMFHELSSEPLFAAVQKREEVGAALAEQLHRERVLLDAVGHALKLLGDVEENVVHRSGFSRRVGHRDAVLVEALTELRDLVVVVGDRRGELL